MSSTDADAPDEVRWGEATAFLEGRIGHRFADPTLLRQALTHSSLNQRGAITYERLEFLGDRVLGLVMADWLWHRFAEDTVGELARRFAALVDQATLARVAKRLELGNVLRMSRGERETGGGANPSVLADACEAVIAAVYLDAGLDTARTVIHRHWQAEVDSELTAPKDPKTALQEWAQAHGLALPLYREIDRVGPPHAPNFLIEVAVNGLAPQRSRGSSKRQAERAAAAAMLAAITGRPLPDGSPEVES